MHAVKSVYWPLPSATVSSDHMEPKGHIRIEDVPGLASKVTHSFKSSVFRDDDLTWAEDAKHRVTSLCKA